MISQCKNIYRILMLFIAITGLLGFQQEAFASALPGSNFMPAGCDNMGQWGFSSSVIYCVGGAIESAAQGYIAVLTTYLNVYFGLCMVVAIGFFGVRLATASVEQLVKETMFLVLKVSVASYLFYNASPIYNTLVGVMNELIGLVSTILTSPSSPFKFPPAGCTIALPPITSGNADQYAVWQMFDCMIGGLFGFPGAAIAVSNGVIAVITAILFTSTMGVFVTILGISACASIIIMLARALYHVLLCYLTLAFLATLMPLLAPLLVFNSHSNKGFTREFFDRWYGLIVSTVFQPMFIVGFLCMTVAVLDTFVDGTMSGCNPTAPTSSGSLCSLKQLTDPADGGVNMDAIEHNATLFSLDNAGDAFKATGDMAVSVATTALGAFSQVQNGIWAGTAKGRQQAMQAAKAFIANPAGSGETLQLMETAIKMTVRVTRLPDNEPLILQFLLTLVAFILTLGIMGQVSETIPAMARRITGGVGLALIQQMRAPFESAITNAVKMGGNAMRHEAGGIKGLLAGGGAAGIKSIPGVLSAGLKGAGQGFMSKMRS